MSEVTALVDATLLSRVLKACVIGAVLVDALDEHQPLIYVNPAFEQLTGYSAAEVLGHNCRFLQGKDREQPGRTAFRQAIDAGVPVTAILRNYRKNGEPFMCEVTLSPLHDDHGRVTHIVGFQQDVTVREAAIYDTAIAHQRLQTTLDSIQDPFVSYDRHWNITYVNAAAAVTFGHPANELISQPLSRVFPDAPESPVVQAAYRALETGVTQRVTTYSEALARELDATAYATDDGVAVLLRDVTSERMAKRELLASQDRFAKVFDANPLAMLITRTGDRRHVDMNPAFEQLSGYAREEVIGHTSADLELWNDPEQLAGTIRSFAEHGQVLNQAAVIRLKSGELCDALLSIVPVTLAGEACVIMLVRDVTEEKRAQRRLEVSEQAARHAAGELQRTLDLSLDLITSIDTQGRFVSVSAASLRLLGYPPEALIGRSYLDYVHPEDRERSVQVQAALRAAPELPTVQTRFQRQDGSVVWLDWTAVRHPDGLTYAIARDITERRAATEDQAFLAAIVRASTDAIIGLALDGTVRAWNAGAERMYGYAPTEMIGRQISTIIPPELQAEEEQVLELAAQGIYTPATETVQLTQAGHRLPVQLSVAPIFDHDGAVVGISKIAQDISGRRETERQILRLNARLQHELNTLSSLREIDLAITSSLDLTITLGLVLDKVKSQVEAEAVTVLLLDPHGLTLEFAATRGFTTASPQGTAVRLGGSLAGHVALTRQPVLMNDLREAQLAEDWRSLLEREDLNAYAAVPLVAKGKVLGVLEVLRRQAFDPSSDWLGTLQTMAGQAAIAVDNAQLLLDLERGNFELGLAYQETIEGWARALDLRDKETEGHSRRVTELTVRLCRQLGVSAAELVHVQRGALLHDIGKMGIADAILLKPGPLTPEEWTEMRRHPEYAVQLLAPIQFLRPALDIPQDHHEKWDGSGYPRGLRGKAIPLTARAFAVVDVYDALTNDRPYRRAWPRERVLAHLQAETGAHFDPEVVQAFLAMLGEMELHL